MNEINFSAATYQRLKTKAVNIGDIIIGDGHPIVLQSMTNTPTSDIAATVAQSVRMYNAGSQLVRITAPTVKDAENLRIIKKQLQQQGYNIPLIADIHYQPKAAEVAARYVEKVRINPGNYTDRTIGGKVDFTDKEYREGLERLRERIKPLAEICNQYGTAIRVGSNHGSLSQRIMSRYGNTPEGMAVAAMELIEAFEDLGFYNMVVSMKASNPRVMIHSVRLMVQMMQKHGTVYPLHLGVTEAGAGREGRIKSAAGIAALLEDGIGDTIRVSLTEPPEDELPVAKKIVHKYHSFPQKTYSSPCTLPTSYMQRENSGFNGAVIAIPCEQLPDNYQWHETDINTISGQWLQNLPKEKNQGIILKIQDNTLLAPCRKVLESLQEAKHHIPVILSRDFGRLEAEDVYVTAGQDFGYFLLDGYGDGIMASSEVISDQELGTILLDVLQASRMRFSKAEFIACPSCGRTQFNIQKALEEVKNATAHMKGLTIGVMGCIVNGPGEMADADYGYVGAGNGKVALFKGREMVENNIPEDEAVKKLVELIENDQALTKA